MQATVNLQTIKKVLDNQEIFETKRFKRKFLNENASVER